MTKITEERFDNCGLVEIHDMEDNVDPLYGMGSTEITEEQLEELKNGKVAYFTDGEYAHILRMRKKDRGCDTCKNNDLEWYEEPCDSCTVGGKNDHYEVKNEQQT